MKQIIPAARLLVAGAVAIGALSLGSAGLAGAATPATASTAAVNTPARQFNCGRANKGLAHIQKLESKIAAGLPELVAAEAKAAKAGHTHRAEHLKKKIARLERTSFKHRLDKVSAKIQAKCKAAAPAA
jgi:hypothetical protein